jgi:hypothetical protein
MIAASPPSDSRNAILQHLETIAGAWVGPVDVTSVRWRASADTFMRDLYCGDTCTELMRTLARVLLSVAASSASCERAFSAAGLFDSALRNRTSEEQLEKMVVFSYNCRRFDREERERFHAFIESYAKMGCLDFNMTRDGTQTSNTVQTFNKRARTTSR